MKSSTMRQAFQGALLAAAQRWRRKLFLQGLFIVIAAAVLAGAVAVPIMDASHFAPATVGAARVLVYLLLFVLLLVFLVVRVPRRGDRQRLLEHIDSHAARRAGDRPDARDTLLLTAVQMDADGVDAPLEQRLYERAAVAVNDPHGSARDDRIGMRRAARALLGLAGFVVIILFMLDDGARHGVQLLLAPWRDAQHGMPYRIAVQPGDTALRERSDVVIEGATLGFVPRTLTLVSRGEGEADWSRTLMQVNAGTTAASLDGHFSAERLAVTAPFEYYLEGDNVRSALHRVQVQWLPRAQRIEHVYHYPRYTGIGERVVPSATDIAAVTGSRVEVRVLPVDLPADLPADLTVRSPEQSPGESLGELVLDDSTRRPLLRDGEMLSASLSVDEASRYRIELPFNAGNKGPPEMVPVTPDHGISALADGAPLVTIARPASDARVTAVEEIAISIQADDDVSLRQVELLYSINGEAEEVIALTPAVPVANASAPSTGPASAAASVNATHTLYLEGRDLKPGDVIAYHARASDGVVSRTAVTDIQFMEVRPFDRDYRRGRSGAGGGGGGGRNQESMAAQQRDLVVALFRLARDSQQLPAEEQARRLTTLSDAQGRIRERVEAIVRRIQGRAMVQNRPGYAVMLEVMPKAITAMTRVEALLAVPDANQSLPSAREALAFLQRADAAFREVQVASQQGGGGGGGGRADNNDLARLFELEMDRFRNRYSQVQRAQAPQRQQQVDATIDKLKELARRQREEIERARRRAEQPRTRNTNGGASGNANGNAQANSGSQASSAGTAATQAALAQALDELLRQLQRLSREQPSAALDAAQQAMQKAAQSMRESMRAAGPSSRAQSAPPSGARAASRADAGADAQASKRQASQANEQAGNQQAGASGSGSSATRPGQDAGQSAGVQAAREALERIDAARRALAGDAGDQLVRAVQRAQQDAQSLVRRQAQIEQRVQAGEGAGLTAESVQADADKSGERLAQARDGGAEPGAPAGARQDGQSGQDGRAGPRESPQGGEDPLAAGNRNGDDDEADRQRSIDELKARMQADALQLREQLDRIVSAQGIRPQVRQPVRRAGEVMREEDVEGRLRHSREQLAAGESQQLLESSIADALERVQEQLAQAADAAAQARGSRAGRSAAQNSAAQNSAEQSSAAQNSAAQNSAGQGGSGQGRAGQNRADQASTQNRGQSPGQTQGRGGSGARGGAAGGMPGAERLREMMRELAGLRDRFGPGGRAGGGSGRGGRSRDDLRDLAADLRGLGGDSRGLVASNTDAAGDLRTLIDGIEALAAQDGAQDEQARDALLEALARVERLVKAQAAAGQATVPTGRAASMPREYRALVEAYYRRLSEGEAAIRQ